jgi:predicted RNA-binding protein (virulence factor B family)
MIEVGQYYELIVVKETNFGFYLDAGNLGEVLLFKKHAPKNLAINDFIRVFLYLDSEDRPIATTQEPKACVNTFAYLKVVDVTRVGAFLDWGLEKDVLVPYSEQHRPMEEGKSYLVYLYLDDIYRRITASSKIDKQIDDDKPHSFKEKQAVDLIIANSTELGFKAIINNSHWGLLYKNEVHVRLSFGQRIKGFIKSIRPDGRIDLSLQGGEETREKYARIIEDYLKMQGGFAPVNDKSDSQLISELFGMSKKAFKKTIGTLYKQRRIRIEKNGIHLVEI